MTEKTYNGWTNYATWRINLEIFDGLYENDLFDLSLEPYDLGNVLQDYVQNHIYESGGGEGNLAVDYALAFIQDVNWYEIAKNLITEYADKEVTE